MASMEELIASTISTFLSQQLPTNAEENNTPPEIKKFEDYTEEEIQEAIKQVISNSTYSGIQRESLTKALHDSICGKTTLTLAATNYGIPFSTIHPYMKKLQIKFGIYDANSKKPRMSLKRQSEDINDESLTPKRARKKNSPLPGYVPFKQISIPQYWLQFPEKMKASVLETVSNCNYDDNAKKKRLFQAIMDVMINKKTLKAAALDNTIPFTTLQSYFHRSRIALEQQMDADEEVQKLKQQSNATESACFEQSPVLECSEQQTGNNIRLMEQAINLLATLPPEQQNYFAQMMINSDFQAPNLRSNTPPPNLSMEHGVNMMMNWLMSQSLTASNLNSFFETPKPPISDGRDISPSSTTSSRSSSNILEELAAMKPIKLEACLNVVNNQPMITVNEVFCKKENVILPSDIHHQSVIFDHEKFAINFINYFVYHCKDINPKDYETMIQSLKNVILEKKPVNQDGSFYKHVLSIQNLMKHITEAFPVFLYQIQPEKSNYARFEDFIGGRTLYHNRLLSQPPNSLMELMKSSDVQLIVKYIKPFVAANMEIDMDFTTFLINEVIKDRSLPELYNEAEYKILHEKIVFNDFLQQ
uniref:HTH psq-type domain-containing protein n=1 Tax=Panagrolaimus sp. PS1159 TaxID=55785 RepID=A0AC35G2M6_9BILA